MKKQAKLRITLLKSTIGHSKRIKAIVHQLGLRKLHQSVEHADVPSIRGLINVVSFLLDVETVA